MKSIVEVSGLIWLMAFGHPLSVFHNALLKCQRAYLSQRGCAVHAKTSSRVSRVSLAIVGGEVRDDHVWVLLVKNAVVPTAWWGAEGS